MNKKRSLLSLCLVVNMSIAGNRHAFTQELQIGDKVPDLGFQNVLNYKSKKARLSDFKGELVILDMWSTMCSNCISAFPKMEELQNEFKDKIQILLVNPYNSRYNSENRITEVLGKIKKRTGYYPGLPMPINDTILNTYFPHQKLPHEIWINADGKIIAITGANEVNAKNIRAVLDGKDPVMHQKMDVSFNENENTLSELIYGAGLKNHEIISNSILIKGQIDGLGSRTGFPNTRNGFYTRWRTTNTSLLKVFQYAFHKEFNNIFPNQVIIDVKDSSLVWQLDYSDPSVYSNAYSYEVTVPPTTQEHLLEAVQRDLQKTFGVKIRKGKNILTCIVLKYSPALDASFAKDEEPQWGIEAFQSKKFIRNYPIDEILENLNNYCPVPLINETGISRNITINLPANLKDKNELIKAFRNAGFLVEEVQKEMDTIVITSN